ncbi:MAG: type II secretion system F family protein [Candidatus Theseobacter exili]|nr:type II secretion system F family protein [Candidatus Theseobacter exili]
MPLYRYKGRKETGEIVEGVLEAHDEDGIMQRVSELGYSISSISQERTSSRFHFQEDILIRFSRIRKTDISQFARQLATMLRSGLTALQAFDVLIEQSENKKFQQVLTQVKRDIEEGISLSNALAKHPKIFSSLFMNTLRVGEESGRLEEVLDQLALFLEKEVDLRAKVKSGLMYPAMLVITAVFVIVFLVAFVFPKFAYVFARAKVPLPPPTRILFQFSLLLRSQWYFILGVIVVIILGALVYIRTPVGRLRVDRLKLNLPLFGKLFRKVAISRFSRSMEILTRSGVNILASLRMVRESAENMVFRNVFENVEAIVSEGQGFTQPLERSGEFPSMAVQMIRVGEETGRMAEAFGNVADNYEQEVDRVLKNLTAILEPVIVVIMAAVVGFIALSIFLPIFDMIKVIK